MDISYIYMKMVYMLCQPKQMVLKTIIIPKILVPELYAQRVHTILAHGPVQIKKHNAPIQQAGMWNTN